MFSKRVRQTGKKCQINHGHQRLERDHTEGRSGLRVSILELSAFGLILITCRPETTQRQREREGGKVHVRWLVSDVIEEINWSQWSQWCYRSKGEQGLIIRPVNTKVSSLSKRCRTQKLEQNGVKTEDGESDRESILIWEVRYKRRQQNEAGSKSKSLLYYWLLKNWRTCTYIYMNISIFCFLSYFKV